MWDLWTNLIQSLLNAVEMEIKLCLKCTNLDWCCKLSIEGDTINFCNICMFSVNKRAVIIIEHFTYFIWNIILTLSINGLRRATRFMRQYQKGLKSLLAWVWWKLFAEGSSDLMHIALQDKRTCCLMSVDLSIFSAWLLNQSNISSLISAGINAIPQSHVWDHFPYIIQYSLTLC